MTDILLIQPPVTDFYLTAKRTVPYGLTCIASALMASGFSVEIFDGLATNKSKIIDWPREMEYLEPFYGRADCSPFALFHHFKHFGYSFQHISAVVKQKQPFLIGISSLFTAYSDTAIQTAQSIKSIYPTCWLVMGGHHPSAMPRAVMAHACVDFVLRGDGEVSMPRLAHALKHGQSPANIPGIVFRDRQNRLVITPPAATDLKSDHLPADHLLKHSFYQRHKRGAKVVVTSRGCPKTCTYCVFGSNSVTPYRRRRIASVIAEIDTAVSVYNAGFIDFEDENLSLDRTWFLKFLAALEKRFGSKNLEMRAMNGLFPPSLDEEIVYHMKQVGFNTLNLSMGTTSVRQLMRFNRPDVTKAVDNAIGLAAKYNLGVVCYIIAGAPFQKAEDTLTDLFFLAQKRALAGVSIFYPAPGSRDFADCRQRGLLPSQLSLLRSSALPVSHTTTRRQAVTLLRLARILNFMKSMADKGVAISEPAPAPDRIDLDGCHRDQMGQRLLQSFLYDKKIRGVASNGQVFEHNISEALTHGFIQGLRTIEVNGYLGPSRT
jgi:anaerobic magnesium-protoporphyrin IX monomethyl ester cyclase